MSSLTNYAEAAIIDHLLRNIAMPSPAAVYLGLFESDPGEDVGGIETSYTGYTRMVSTWTALDGAGQTKNIGSVSFPANGNGAAPVTITHAVLFDALTGGNRIIKGALGTPKTIEITDVLAFSASGIVLTID